jgi:hypothetical protein
MTGRLAAQAAVGGGQIASAPPSMRLSAAPERGDPAFFAVLGGPRGGYVGKTCGMRPLPPSIPGARSRKWPSRRSWDPLGYVRVRQLSDPHWRRDPAWVLDQLSWARRFAGTSDLRALLDLAEERVRAYTKAGRPVWEDDQANRARRESEWDDVLEAIDTFLVALQVKHLREVDEAGVSGRGTNR